MKTFGAWSALAAGASITALALLLNAGSPASAASPVFTATPLSNTAGGVETVASVDKCPAPVGAGDWVAIVNVAQGANPQVSFKNFLIAGDGSWGGTLTLPAGLTPGAAHLTAACFDAHHDVADEVDYADVNLTITLPATSSAASSTAASTSTGPATSTPASASASGGGNLANTGFGYTVPFTLVGFAAMVIGGLMLFGTRRTKRAH